MFLDRDQTIRTALLTVKENSNYIGSYPLFLFTYNSHWELKRKMGENTESVF